MFKKSTQQSQSTGGTNNINANAQINDLRTISEIELSAFVVVGKRTMKIGELLTLSPGAVIELDKRVGEPIEVWINGKLFAKGELVLSADQRLAITITEIVNGNPG